MKFLALPTFDVVTSALNFDTPDCHVSGGCDLYTTKAAGSDKKLYKNISQSLEEQHAALVEIDAALSPPQRESIGPTLDLSRPSPFGDLSEVSSRRTYAYLIATLNASHPDYDFSHVLRPMDFKREKSLKRVMNKISSTLQSVRPNASFLDVSIPCNSPRAAAALDSGGLPLGHVWGPQMWTLIDKEMALKDCSIFSYQPASNAFDEEDGAIWALHYFFFSKAKKRVCYLYVRGTPVMSQSPQLRPHYARSAGTERSSSMKRRAFGLEESGANKRARFWLGDQVADRIAISDDEGEDDGLVWNRDADGDMTYGCDDEDDYEDSLADEEAEDDGDESDSQQGKGPVRGVSEDIAASMEIEI
ncbi:repressor of RNA polymerase III transcription MAF1 [Thozetella sp. PMI_491]|nr:repressor of RNA polymerase III transcription MAF1 [Thozetella sp. PMI_491]